MITLISSAKEDICEGIQNTVSGNVRRYPFVEYRVIAEVKPLTKLPVSASAPMEL